MSGGGAVVWVTGLPASGKSTLAGRLAARLRADRVPCLVLDGDAVRAALGRPAGRGADDRDRFYAALGSLAATFAEQGLVVIVPATAPRRAHRDAARALAPRFLEVLVATPLEACARRDPKGLYAAARRGEAPELPGAGAPYEPPLAPDVIASGGEDERAVEALLAKLVT
ncbi:adenylyl-sulfate kinase [Anaeromyxobacter oryzae]|uniref:Adenylyl-sulfate kinase n=1 Tax=Anaeromyxobacter oryzae TaxID=2918170 RepID=A0ABM7WU50_9BACT|nr:adenylyl-sulfate kinase [Anaeromyxobacter oryzae]BDG03000.1 adenylyl-sulfate kinase [Anaeromyxobacter oryzae]